MKRKGGTARDRLKEAWNEIAARRTETGYEAVLDGRAGRKSRRPYPSKSSDVNPAGARGRSAEDVVGQTIGRRPERSPKGVEGEGE